MSRNIVLLSDGTDNSAAKVWRTNVWRTFDALDLSGADQVAFYDDGVGTSSFKPLAILGGAFGYGLNATSSTSTNSFAEITIAMTTRYLALDLAAERSRFGWWWASFSIRVSFKPTTTLSWIAWPGRRTKITTV